MGNKITLRFPQRRMSTDTFHKSNNSLRTQTHFQLFELIRFDAFMLKHQNRYWIETKAEWTTVQNHDNIRIRIRYAYRTKSNKEKRKF